jgi:uncharacterized protein YraI
MSFASTRLRRAGVALSFLVLAIWAIGLRPAEAAPPRPNGYPVTNVNLRAGPNTDFPVIVTVPNRAWISILGCLADYGWCDVFFEGNRGWMRSIYLAGWYQGYYYPLRDYAPQLGYPVVTFDIGTYWDAYYRGRPFYADRARWGGPRQEGWVDHGAFYDRLAPYGQWTWLEGQYVFVPGGVDRAWRPYTDGRWVYTDRYGWMWASNEPFGWATYHYGRWGFSKRIGWFWVPGNRWAPAWVSWRKSDDYLAWAPLPPSYDEGANVQITARDVPAYYWQAVPSNQFLAPDLPRRILRDPARVQPVLEQTQPLGNVVVNNTTVVNNVVNLQFVEQKTQEQVVVHRVERTGDAEKAGKVEGASVEIFQPQTDQKPAIAAPPKPMKIEEVAAESKTKEQAGAAPATESMLLPPEIKTPEAAQATPPAPPPPPPPASKGAAPAGEQAAPPPPPPAKETTPAAETSAPPSPGKEAAPSAGEQGTPPIAGEATPAPKTNGKEAKEKEKSSAQPSAEGTPSPASPAEGAPPLPQQGEQVTPDAKKKVAPSGEEALPPPGEQNAPHPKMKVTPPEEAVPPNGALLPPPSGEAVPPPPVEATKPHLKKKVAPPPEGGAPPPPPAPGEGAPPPPPSAGEVAPPPPPMEDLAPKSHWKSAPAGEGALPPAPGEGAGPPPPPGGGALEHKRVKPPAEEGAPPPAGEANPNNHKKKAKPPAEEAGPPQPEQTAPPPAGEAAPPPWE